MTETQLAVIETVSANPTMSQGQVAKTVGISQPMVSKTLAKPEIRALVEEVQHGFVQANARRAAGNITQIIHSAKPKDKELRLKYSAEVGRAMGMLPSQAASVFINNIYNDNRTQEMPPEILALLKSQGVQKAVDVEYEELDR